MSNIIHKTFAFLMVGVTAIGATACDDDEVAAGVAGAVIGAGVAGVFIDHSNDCRPGYRTVCSNYFDYYGNLRRDCREVRYACGNRRTASPLEAMASGNRIEVRQHAAANGLTVEDFAKTYRLGFEQADSFWSALDASDQGNAEPLKALGLSGDDIQRIGQYELPTNKGIDNVAKSLDQRPDLTEGMFNRIRAWALSERTRICRKPTLVMTIDEKNLCNIFD